MPVKYSAVKPELVLKANHVLTEDTVDPASLLCADKNAAHIGAVISLVNTDAIVAAVQGKGADVKALSPQEIKDAETAAGVTDTPWVSTPFSTPMLESQIVEAGWGCVIVSMISSLPCPDRAFIVECHCLSQDCNFHCRCCG